MYTRQDFFINDYDRIFTVKFMWDIGQPFICGTLKEVVKYALNRPNNGIEFFAEISGVQIKKLTKKQLKAMLLDSSFEDLQNLGKELFKKY